MQLGIAELLAPLSGFVTWLEGTNIEVSENIGYLSSKKNNVFSHTLSSEEYRSTRNSNHCGCA